MQEGIVDAHPGLLEDLGCVEIDRVDPGSLLKDADDNADNKDEAEGGKEEIRDSGSGDKAFFAKARDNAEVIPKRLFENIKARKYTT